MIVKKILVIVLFLMSTVSCCAPWHKKSPEPALRSEPIAPIEAMKTLMDQRNPGDKPIITIPVKKF